ncbi:hypothetical protein ACFSCW_14900 [Sphingomonas tabacisoli]|uniref:Uncharacterized protein n=1 Tax=Sphingomonas tabacisoli TaxID=2249466 RepID=A0ABW4I6E7_9SPHN
MSQAEVIRNMKERADRCRRLASQILDENASKALREMAHQIEADIEELARSATSP